MASILIVDDERGMRDFLAILLQKEGHKCTSADNIMNGLKLFKSQYFDLVISDIRMPGGSGLDLLEAIKEENSNIPVILITAFAAPGDAVIAMKNGAFDYISKPFDVNEIKSVIKSGINSSTENNLEKIETNSFPNIIGDSREMVKIFDLIQKVAPTPASVLILGESGTGKELVAKAIHDYSAAAQNSFVPITCSAIPEELMESELFGHVKGSFTGAIGNKTGLFEEADGGTAFLDEIGELSPIIQTKLLRVLQEREIKPVGSSRSKNINTRIIAATHKNLEEEIINGNFREDLFYRLSVVPLRIPPLRERKGDIPLLVDHFLEKYSKRLGKAVKGISSYALEVLMKYDFPGNVRQLENIIERSVALENSTIILPETLNISNSNSFLDHTTNTDNNLEILSCEEELFDLGLEQVMTRLEKKLISHALQKTKNSKMKAAELLQISFRSLRYKIKKYNIS